MFSTANQIATNDQLLREVATAGSFPDPTLFVYGVLAISAMLFVAVAYLIFGRAKQVNDGSLGADPAPRGPSPRGLRQLKSATKA